MRTSPKRKRSQTKRSQTKKCLRSLRKRRRRRRRRRRRKRRRKRRTMLPVRRKANLASARFALTVVMLPFMICCKRVEGCWA